MWWGSAEEQRRLEAQSRFLGPQLPHAWVPEAQQQSERHEAVMDSIRAYASVLQKRLKPVHRSVTCRESGALMEGKERRGRAVGGVMDGSSWPVYALHSDHWVFVVLHMPCRYRPEADLGPAAVRARELRRAAESRAHGTWLGPQLQEAWTADAAALDMSKRPGRERVVVKKKGQVEVVDFTAPAAAGKADEPGPGHYDVPLVERENVLGYVPDWSKMRSREESRGPFGERAPAEEAMAGEWEAVPVTTDDVAGS